ncbi:GlxA family transcriptional regulator [Tenggerimyces flavus]|uniref:GlxA family transcriptional regulator n=1 Tax=Tenggerimyces flavus TaxID=1708749 RepID=A0ABV7Y8J2_9ACTN|nr:helix-turn-helix domain-containing protein [Tenggerimyces flavus]MBM7785596.1 transcriptional regulator GlxA family with amidase domain [Tenggerimyces flavus]
MHIVAIITLEKCGAMDLSMPSLVFGHVHLEPQTSCRDPLYEVWVCGPPVTATFPGAVPAFEVIPHRSWADAADADTILVPGLCDYTDPPPPEVVDLLRVAHQRGKRIGSICDGVFVLAAAGLLDGRRAAAHWGNAAELAALYPQVRVDDSVLFVDEGDIVTSAGGAAALDLCLHLVLRDYGSVVAAEAARHAVMPLARDGGQAQFIAYAEPESGGSLEPVMHWMEERLDQELTLTDIADEAATSVRSLNRRFREQTGTTPLQWLIRRRLLRARELLETTELSVEEIAPRAGFGTAIALRQHFRRTLGTTPVAYRRAFTPPRSESP